MSYLILGLALLVVLAALCPLPLLNPLKLVRAFRDQPSFVVVTEPSMFRTDETRVLGPFGGRWGYLRAVLEARLFTLSNSYGEATIVPASTRVQLGNRVLWPLPSKETPCRS